MKLPKVQSCSFLPVTSLKLSPRAMLSLSQSSSLTFGDANRTLFAVSKVISAIDANKSDAVKLQAVADELGADFYIDLEN